MQNWMDDDREVLARTLMAEAGNQGPLGMLAAGSVIMNRARTPGYGDGVQGVILKPGQFSPWNSVTGYAGGEQGQNMAAIRPTSEAYSVADRLLSGQYEDPTGGATHFYNPDISTPSWGQSAGGDWTRIGAHVFGRADAGRNGRGGNMQPQGLLSTGGQAQPERLPFFRRPEVQDLFDTLAIGFGGMTMNPNQALIGAVQERMGQRREQAQTTAQRNSTLDYLRSLKTPQAQEALRYAEGTGDITGALRMATAQPEQTALMQNVQWLMSQGIPMEEALQTARSGSVVNVGAQGEPRPELLGTQGLVAIPDPSVPEGYRVVPAPGSPIAVERERERAKLESAEQAKGTGRARAANIVSQDIKRFRDLVENAPWYDPATGFGARTLSDVGGTTAANAAELSETIRANIGFDRLQQMREESPTGGALGQVAVQELQALQSVLGSLSQAQTREQLLFNLDRLDEVYGEIVRKASAYPNAGKFGFGTDQGDGPARVTSDEEYDALPPGTVFVGPDGKTRRKP